MRARQVIAGALLVAIAGCAGPAAATSGSPASRPGRDGPSARPASHTARVADNGTRSATLSVLSGAASVTVTAVTMPGTLARAWTPAGSRLRPELVAVSGTVQVYLGSTGQSGPDAVWIQVSSAVRWRLQLSGGASQTTIQMGNGQLAGLDFTAGSSLITAALPRPAGTVTLTLAGGASQLNLTVPAGVPARLQLYGGASQAVLGGQVYSGLGGGTVLTGPGWTGTRNRYDLDATSGVSQVTVTG
jgi:hypothetical protein